MLIMDLVLLILIIASLVSERRSPVRPWARYWARWADLGVAYSLASAPLAGIAAALNAQAPSMRVLFFLILMVFTALWAMVEALLLSTWGTTPGKWLLKIRVRDAAGQKLTYAGALKRSVSVWWLGLGMSNPFLMVLMMYSACRTLLESSATHWDRDGKFAVSHGAIGAPGIIAVAGSILFASWVWKGSL